jgi:hypothetical protein
MRIVEAEPNRINDYWHDIRISSPSPQGEGDPCSSGLLPYGSIFSNNGLFEAHMHARWLAERELGIEEMGEKDKSGKHLEIRSRST